MGSQSDITSINRVQIDVRTDGTSLVSYYEGQALVGSSQDTDKDGKADVCQGKQVAKPGQTQPQPPSQDFQNYVCGRHKELVSQVKRFKDQAPETNQPITGPHERFDTHFDERKTGYTAGTVRHFDPDGPSGPVESVAVRTYTKDPSNTSLFDAATQTQVVYGQYKTTGMATDDGFSNRVIIKANIKEN